MKTEDEDEDEGEDEGEGEGEGEGEEVTEDLKNTVVFTTIEIASTMLRELSYSHHSFCDRLFEMFYTWLSSFSCLHRSGPRNANCETVIPRK